jgi:hypothetical protein
MKITPSIRMKLSLLFSVFVGIAVPNLCAGFSDPAGQPGGSNIATVGAVPHTKIMEISHEIDRLVKSQLEENRRELNPLATDEVFLRRTYLNIIGRIPTLDETNRFLNSNRKQKRAELIDDLLDSYGYVSRQYNFWADLLRIRSRQPPKDRQK